MSQFLPQVAAVHAVIMHAALLDPEERRRQRPTVYVLAEKQQSVPARLLLSIHAAVHFLRLSRLKQFLLAFQVLKIISAVFLFMCTILLLLILTYLCPTDTPHYFLTIWLRCCKGGAFVSFGVALAVFFSTGVTDFGLANLYTSLGYALGLAMVILY